jgi:hypothetical protein
LDRLIRIHVLNVLAMGECELAALCQFRFHLELKAELGFK